MNCTRKNTWKLSKKEVDTPDFVCYIKEAVTTRLIRKPMPRKTVRTGLVQNDEIICSEINKEVYR